MTLLRRPAFSRIRQSASSTQRCALTLVEMLIGMAITLVMMAAVVNLFANIGAGVRLRQATIEMSAQLRTVRATLFNDLTHATCRALPWQRPDEDPGYLELVEGERTDKDPTVLNLNLAISQIPGSQDPNAGDATDALGLGDYDDILALTVRSELAPYKGRYVDSGGNSETIESTVAEVIWFAIENDGSTVEEPGMRKIYRRELLVAPWADLSGIAPPSGINPASYEAFYNVCDVSVRIEQPSPGTYIWVPNTLGDLTKRENRYGHYSDFDTLTGAGYPHYFPHDGAGNIVPNAGTGTSLVPLGGDRVGEDLMLENVLAFDVLVFDPWAPLFLYEGVVIEPVSDSVFNTANAVTPSNLAGFGAYADLGWDDNGDYVYTAYANAQEPQFQQEREVGWHPRAPNNNREFPVVYDTWSFHYEHDGIDQDGVAGVDQGTNGLDDVVPYPNPNPPPATVNEARNGVDDIGERETSPPYDAPLRGMQVKIRIYEPDTRQVREVSVTRSFVPQ